VPSWLFPFAFPVIGIIVVIAIVYGLLVDTASTSKNTVSHETQSGNNSTMSDIQFPSRSSGKTNFDITGIPIMDYSVENLTKSNPQFFNNYIRLNNSYFESAPILRLAYDRVVYCKENPPNIPYAEANCTYDNGQVTIPFILKLIGYTVLFAIS